MFVLIHTYNVYFLMLLCSFFWFVSFIRQPTLSDETQYRILVG